MPMRRGVAVVLCVALVGTAGCSSRRSPSHTPQQGPPAGAVADPLHPAGLDRMIHLSKTPFAPPAAVTDRSRELVSVGWTLIAIRSHGRDLVLSYNSGGCDAAAGVTVAQGRQYVMLTAYDLTPKPTKKQLVCPANAVVAVGFVRLAKPLGHRTLYHAPISPGR